jgi:hypothetical protein
MEEHTESSVVLRPFPLRLLIPTPVTNSQEMDAAPHKIQAWSPSLNEPPVLLSVSHFERSKRNSTPVFKHISNLVTWQGNSCVGAIDQPNSGALIHSDSSNEVGLDSAIPWGLINEVVGLLLEQMFFGDISTLKVVSMAFEPSEASNCLCSLSYHHPG